jgi:alpha-beta hydrolase superfamily lysophospholipase
VLHSRIGGPATAALLAHSIGGLIGMLLAVTLVAATVVKWGPALSLSLALGISVAWNLMLIAAKQGRALFMRRPR